jgi:hypothetical protein
MLAAMMWSQVSLADIPVKNPEYAAQAKVAARAIYESNWGVVPANEFEVIAEEYQSDDLGVEGTYRVRVFIQESGEKTDSGIDLNIYIYNKAVLEVKVDCRVCG